MKTEKIIIEIPTGKTDEEVRQILRDVANSFGKSIPRERIAKAEAHLRNSVWPEGIEAVFIPPA
ncbi:hypothetical protein [Chitinophaga sp. YIM B06452]|uniref:hypothetical protein n=1 Tax=Chitinophaga sp. YIM B06452 TaxID=3082158 RepID=UPI0031FF27D8